MTQDPTPPSAFKSNLYFFFRMSRTRQDIARVLHKLSNQIFREVLALLFRWCAAISSLVPVVRFSRSAPHCEMSRFRLLVDDVSL